MRIEGQNPTIELSNSSKQTIKPEKTNVDINNEQFNIENPINSNEKLELAIGSMNEILELNNKQLKFVYHDGLEQYYVQLVDSTTEEVIKEIPSKKLLDAFYEMQKLVGIIVDEKR